MASFAIPPFTDSRPTIKSLKIQYFQEGYGFVCYMHIEYKSEISTLLLIKYEHFHYGKQITRKRILYANSIQKMRRLKSTLTTATSAQPHGSNRQWTLKPQDLAIALKLVVLRGERLPYRELGQQMRLSQFEAHAATQRLLAARLAVEMEGVIRPVTAVLEAFLLYGAPYAFPPVRGEMTIGFPTAYGASPLKEKVLFSDENPPIWPHPEGTHRGLTLQPLYENLPLAARDDKALYELLALVDALRIGQARERELAAGLLRERLP
jgi:hypothetical protein